MVTTVLGTLFAVGRGSGKGVAALETLLDAGRGEGGGALWGVVSWVVLAAMGASCESRGGRGGGSTEVTDVEGCPGGKRVVRMRRNMVSERHSLSFCRSAAAPRRRQ